MMMPPHDDAATVPVSRLWHAMLCITISPYYHHLGFMQALACDALHYHITMLPSPRVYAGFGMRCDASPYYHITISPHHHINMMVYNAGRCTEVHELTCARWFCMTSRMMPYWLKFDRQSMETVHLTLKECDTGA